MARRNSGKPALLGAALAYAGRGVPIFPCEPGGKRPLTHSGFWEATADEVLIRAWWHLCPAANIAVPTGKSSGLVVLDVDPEEGGEESLAALQRANGSHPRTASSRTGGGGTHLFYRYPGQEIRNSVGFPGPGLDVRGDGGYLVVPPSRTAGPYAWLDRSRPASATWLLGCLLERAKPPAGETLF